MVPAAGLQVGAGWAVNDLRRPVYLMLPAHMLRLLLCINIADTFNALLSLLCSTATVLLCSTATVLARACWCCLCRLQVLECLLLCTSSVYGTSQLQQGHSSELNLAGLQFLRSALSAAGVTPPPSPQLNLTFLQTAADLAVGQTLVSAKC